MALDLNSESGGPVVKVPVRRLQPLNRAPYAAWTLSDKNGDAFEDRLGGGFSRRLQTGLVATALRIPSPVAGMSAFANNGLSSGENSGRATASDPAFAGSLFASSGLSMAFWAVILGHATNPGNSDEAHLISFTTTQAGGWLPWYVSPQPTIDTPSDPTLYRVNTYANGGGAMAKQFALRHTIGKWEFCCFSHAANGDVLYGIDGNYVSHSGVPLYATGGRFTLLGDNELNAYLYGAAGALFDMVMWNKPSTQADFETQRAYANGK